MPPRSEAVPESRTEVTPSNRPSVLYLSYDGLLEPLGESQVVAYIERLASDASIALISFEKSDDLEDSARVAAMAERLRAVGVEWVRLRYHRNPPVLSTVFDVVVGTARARAIARERHVEIVHARSYVASLIALGVRQATGAAYLFDMRGFWVDEKVEGGHWRPGGMLYRIGKWWERKFLATADGVVSLTSAGVEALRSPPFSLPATVPTAVIPTCVDLTRFVPGPRNAVLAEELGLGSAPVIGCVGTISNWYLRAEMLEFLAFACRELPAAKVLFVTREDYQRLRADALNAGIPAERLVLTRASFSEMPRYLSLIDVGLFFIRPTFAKRGSAATKMAEFLAAGIPVVINDGVGDSGGIVRDHGVGIVIDGLDPVAFDTALPAFRSLIADETIEILCREVAERLFDLELGVQNYKEMYQTLIVRNRQERVPAPQI